MLLSARVQALFSAACLLALASCSTGGTAATAASIKIGVDVPLSGLEGQAGTPVLNGVRFFVQQHPAIDGFNVAVTATDDAVNGVHNPDRGARNMAALVADRHVFGVVGPFDASVARAEIPIANPAGLAMISPSASARCLTKDPYLPGGLSPNHVEVTCKDAGLPSPKDLRPSGINNFFRLATTDDLQGPAAAEYGYKNLHLLRVAVLSDHEAYGQALAAGFITRFTKLGGSVVRRLDVDPAQALDLTDFFNQSKREGAQAIYFGGVTTNKGCVIRARMAAVFEPGETTPYLGGDGIAEDPACVSDAGTNAIGIYATVATANADRIDGAKAVIKAFKAAYPNPADYGAYTIAAYDATGVLYDALDRAIKAAGGKLPARDAIVTQLAATTTYRGATGTLGFDPEGDTTQRIVSIYEPAGLDPRVGWNWVNMIDYSATLPY